MVETQTPDLPTGKRFFRVFSVAFGVVGAGAAAVILLYLAALLQLPPEQARGLWWTVAIIAVGLTPLFNWIQARFMRDLVVCLDAVSEGRASPEQLRLGFRTAIDLPRRCALFGFSNFQIASLVAVFVMSARFEEFRAYSAMLIVAAALSGGLLANLIQFFVVKRILDPVREGLARRLPDAAERDSLVHRVPLVRKIALVLVTVALVPVVFAVFLAHSRATSSAASLARDLQRGLLARASEGIASGSPAGITRALDRLRGEARDWHLPVELVAIELPPKPESPELREQSNADEVSESPDGSTVALGAEKAADTEVVPPPAAVHHSGRRDLLSEGEIALLIGFEEERGDLEKLRSDNVASWVRIPLLSGGALVLVAATPRESLGIDAGLAALFGLLVAVSTVVALLVAWLMATDVGRAARSLEQQAERIAQGDLRGGLVLEGEDELGRLGGSFARMAVALRSTVGQVVATANRVEQTGGEICSTASEVSERASGQVHGVQHSVGAMNAILGQVGEISDAVRALNMLSEESSSSVLEMSAAGDQLRDTAGALSGRVDEVSNSIEEITRSVSEVRGNTATLFEAAEETSSSMEEMAAAMGQVDATAEETARLSLRVTEAADTGREKVAATIQGMESIRDATQAAERVIQGLGRRAIEIGAVLDVIDDVANRTNLLALNASIIAAQAGEHGRAFAVVGNEIAELAARVRSSTKEISEKIRSVQDESENAVGAIERGSRSVASGMELAGQAGASLEEITAAARQSGERSREIVASVREQSKAAGHVAGMMERVRGGLDGIRRATEEQSRGHEAVAESARVMRDVATQLRSTTDEQSRGARQLRESVEGVRGAVESIHVSIDAQSASCTSSASLLQGVADQTRSNEEGVHRMEAAIRALMGDSEALRAEVRRFVID